jgi:ribonuclease HI
MKKNEKLIIYSDGGARGNPGPAGIGVVIETGENEVVETYKEYIGETTNNQAEYRAVIKGLVLAKSLKVRQIEVRLDSELVVNQLNMEFKIKNSELALLFVKIWNLRQEFQQVTFKHIPREQNTLADKLVNQALDEAV